MQLGILQKSYTIIKEILNLLERKCIYAVKISNLCHKSIVSKTCKWSTKSTSRWSFDIYIIKDTMDKK